MWYFVLMRRMPERKVMRDESDVSGFILSKWLFGPIMAFDKFLGIDVGNLEISAYNISYITRITSTKSSTASPLR